MKEEIFSWRDHAVWRGIELINTTRIDVNESQDKGEKHCRDELSNILVIFVTGRTNVYGRSLLLYATLATGIFNGILVVAESLWICSQDTIQYNIIQ